MREREREEEIVLERDSQTDRERENDIERMIDGETRGRNRTIDRKTRRR